MSNIESRSSGSWIHPWQVRFVAAIDEATEAEDAQRYAAWVDARDAIDRALDEAEALGTPVPGPDPEDVDVIPATWTNPPTPVTRCPEVGVRGTQCILPARHYEDCEYAPDPWTVFTAGSSTEVACKVASRESVAVMLAAEVCVDGRSEWSWFRLSNGDLIFGCFPCGETYCELEGDHSS